MSHLPWQHGAVKRTTTSRRPRSGEATAWLHSGALAAGVGLSATAVLVLLLWATSPYADGTPHEALHLAADLWLLAHGVELLRTQTTDGVPAPLGVPPILLTVLPAYLLWRAGASASDPLERRVPPIPLARLTAAVRPRTGGGRGAEDGPLPADTPRVLYAVGWLSAGYLLVALPAALVAATGSLRLGQPVTLLSLPLLTVCCTTAGVLRATRGPRPSAGRRRGAGRPAAAPRPTRPVAVLRATRSGTLALCGAGAALTLGALVAHVGAARHAVTQLTDDVSGWVGLVLLSLALLPNAAVWAVAYGLGPGFTVAGGLAAPLAAAAVDAPTALPFPLLAAVPAGGADGGALPLLAVAAVPLAGGLAVAWSVGRSADLTEGPAGTAVTALLAAAGCGGATALLAGFAGGPLGTGNLAHVGPSWWLTGLAALVWTALLGVPGALLLHRVRLRRSVPAEPDGPPGWHATPARERRYALLKETSGGLMADFPPRSPLDD